MSDGMPTSEVPVWPWPERPCTGQPDCVGCNDWVAGHGTGHPMGLVVTKMPAYLPVSHEALIDSGTHTCDGSCPPPYVPPPIPLRRRVQAWFDTIAWRIRRLPGYRLVHKDDMPDDEW